MNETGVVTNNWGNTSYTFTDNGLFVFQFADTAGNTGTITAVVNNIDKTGLAWMILYSATGQTNQNVVATVSLNKTWTITNNGWSASYTFTWNGSFVFQFIDSEGNTWSAFANVTWIDKTAPIGTVNYSTTGQTNQNVIATVSLNESWTITNNWGLSSYTFTGNGTFTFQYTDIAGNTGSATATVSNIDKTPILGTVNYSTTGITNQNVIATISLNKTWTITNNWGSSSYTFTWNGSFTFQFTDVAGNTGSTTATVSNIDKTPVLGTINYSTTGITNQNVVATISLNKTWTITNNWGSTSYTFTWNGSFTFQFTDTAGNTGSTTATVNNIDKIAPIGTINYSTTGQTNQNIIVMLSLNKTGTITNNGGSAVYIFTGNGSFTFQFRDTAGNTGSAIATVSTIDKTPITWVVNYTITWLTNQDVIATVSLNKTWTITNNWGSSSYTFTRNGSFTFQFTDTAGNTGSATATVNNIDKTPVIDVRINSGNTNQSLSGWKLELTGWQVALTGTTTVTGLNLEWTGQLVIYASGSTHDAISFMGGGTSIISSWTWDNKVSAPVALALLETGVADFGEVWVPAQISWDMKRTIVDTIKAWSDTSSLYITGTYFQITYKVESGISWAVVNIIRSEDWDSRQDNTPDTQCILDENKLCTFNTDRLSYFGMITESKVVAVPVTPSNNPSNGWGGGGGWGGGWAPATTDPTDINVPISTELTWIHEVAWTTTGFSDAKVLSFLETNKNNTDVVNAFLGALASTEQSTSTPELKQAYLFAYMNWITTKPTIDQAKMDNNLTRAEMAKMMSEYAIKILGKQPVMVKKCSFQDLTWVAFDLQLYVQKVCQLWIMGVEANGSSMKSFNPYRLVTRAEFGTVLSRLLWWDLYNTTSLKYYTNHLKALNTAWVISKINPEIQELRWYVMLMLMRSQGIK